MTICEKLAANHLFGGINPEDLVPIRDTGEVLDASAGTSLIEEGDANTHLYLVLAGEVEVFLPETPERFSAVRLGTRGVGTCVGEYAFIDHKPASASVVTSKSSELFRISYSALDRLLSTNDALGRAVYRNLLSQLIDRLRDSDSDLDLFRPL